MDILEAIRSGSAPPAARLAAARGLLAAEPAVLLEILFFLSSDAEAEVREMAAETIRGLPERVLATALWDEERPAELLAFFAAACSGQREALEAVILNPSTADETILHLARSVEPELMELIVINQVRILRRPEILDALLENPAPALPIRRRVEELRHDFFRRRAAGLPPAAPADSRSLDDDELLSAEPGGGGFEAAVAATPATAPGGAPAGRPRAARLTLQQKLARLDIVGKIRLAKMGSREERMHLVRDQNRLVCLAAVRSPKITESEIEAVAQMRNVNDEVLRHIGGSREWIRHYPVVASLVRNPRTPAGLAGQFISRLTNLDLRVVSRDRNVPEGVRQLCQKLLSQRLAPRGQQGGGGG